MPPTVDVGRASNTVNNGGNMNNAELISTAEYIATQAHAGQVDKNEVDYIDQPRGVAAQFDPATQPYECAVAWMQDVLEDTDLTTDVLREVGIPFEVIDALRLLTKNSAESNPDAYYARIMANALALAVKAADIANNTGPALVAKLDPATRDRLAAKYQSVGIKLGLTYGY